MRVHAYSNRLVIGFTDQKSGQMACTFVLQVAGQDHALWNSDDEGRNLFGNWRRH
jgi:hypothetical protein